MAFRFWRCLKLYLYLCIAIRHPPPACIIYALIAVSAKCIWIMHFHMTFMKRKMKMEMLMKLMM